MKRLFLIVVCLALLAFVTGGPVFARFDREEAREAGYVEVATRDLPTGDGTMVSRSCHVYAATLYASVGNAFVTLYDLTAAPSGATGGITDIKIELGEATQYDSTRQVYDPPIQFDTGVYADFGAGSVTLEYR